MALRVLKTFTHRWKYLAICLIAVYCFCILPDGITYSLFTPTRQIFDNPADSGQSSADEPHSDQNRIQDDVGENKNDKVEDNKPAYLISSQRYGNLFVESIVGEPENSLQLRLNVKVDKKASPRMILSWNAGHSAENLGGCPDWNCQFSTNKNDLTKAGAIITMSSDGAISAARKPEQYVVYFSQESPVHSSSAVNTANFYNLSLNFRRDTASSSPYGYTVKLAPKSRPDPNNYVDKKLINDKKKTVAWFVSHCTTHSRREDYVSNLKKYIDVDIYGLCGNLSCARKGICENMLDTDYHFYIAFENSICQDYLTEKLWSQGFQRTIIPLVLKREHVAPYVPSKSFIAIDDFASVEELAHYLHYLINNKTAYMEYFEWRREYKVIFLDGSVHDSLERPWGFCQLCRLLWQEPKEQHIIANFNTFWRDSCEIQGSLVKKLLAGKRKV